MLRQSVNMGGESIPFIFQWNYLIYIGMLKLEASRNQQFLSQQETDFLYSLNLISLIHHIYL